MPVYQILILGVIQGLAELLPVSSSAHVIVAEKLMGLDPSDPQMTFLLVMLHTGTMFAVISYFWKRWRALFYSRRKPGASQSFMLDSPFFRMVMIATLVTGVVGFSLKLFLEKILLPIITGKSHNEIEHLFKNLPLMATALFGVGILIIAAGKHELKAERNSLSKQDALWIGLIQGLCLPFRGFSRSGATISMGLLRNVSRSLSEDFSFALAVVITPAVIVLEFIRLWKHTGDFFHPSIFSGLLGMFFSFLSGSVALRWLSNWLENGRWQYFGYYCLFASAGVFTVNALGY